MSFLGVKTKKNIKKCKIIKKAILMSWGNFPSPLDLRRKGCLLCYRNHIVWEWVRERERERKTMSPCHASTDDECRKDKDIWNWGCLGVCVWEIERECVVSKKNIHENKLNKLLNLLIRPSLSLSLFIFLSYSLPLFLSLSPVKIKLFSESFK